jgi:hypothetical protein
LAADPHHGIIVRTKLTRKIGELMPDIVDELTAAFGDQLKVTEGELARSIEANCRLDACEVIPSCVDPCCKT